jgi:hypothetical protein
MDALEALEDEFRTRCAMINSNDVRDELIGHYTIRLNGAKDVLTRSLFLCCLGDLMQEGDGHGGMDISLSYYEAACKMCKFHGRSHSAIARGLMSKDDTIGVLYHLAIAMNLRITNSRLRDLKGAAWSVLRRCVGRELDTKYLCAFICERWIVVREVCSSKRLWMLTGKKATIGALMVYHRVKSGTGLRQQDMDMLERICMDNCETEYVMKLIRNDPEHNICSAESCFELEMVSSMSKTSS